VKNPSSILSRGALAATAIVIVGTNALAQSAGADPVRIQRDIATLADPKWEGRATCSAGGDSAAAYIAARFRTLGLEPAGSTPANQGKREFFEHYVVRASGAAANGIPAQCNSQNVVAVLRGTDPVLAKEFVVVGAHYDHLGRNAKFALDPDAKDAIRPGADDNASGTAGVMELARLFRAHPAKRSLLFVTFSGEEWGALGSAKFVAEDLPTGRIQAMVNFDMIGRLRGDSVFVIGTGTATEMEGIVDSQNTGKTPLVLRKNPDGNGSSDQNSFYTREFAVPVLHFFTELHSDYHKATDVASKINSPGEARVLDYASRVIRAIADRNPPLTVVWKPAPVRAGGSGTQPYLGSTPDMAAGDTPGLRVTGIAAGSPAEKAGMKAGDIVVELAGNVVTDINTYAAALYARKPGDTITIVVLRDGKRVSVTAVLTKRGG
jgi:aminopeptidase YwaD